MYVLRKAGLIKRLPPAQGRRGSRRPTQAMSSETTGCHQEQTNSTTDHHEAQRLYSGIREGGSADDAVIEWIDFSHRGTYKR